MAVVAPMPVSTHTSSFNRYHNPNKRNSDLEATLVRSASSGSTVSSSPQPHRRITTLESLAAEIQKLSSSPSAAFSYLDGDVYGANISPPTPGRAKSRSLPNINRYQTKSNFSPKSSLRKSKSVRFADTQGLPLVAAVHQLTPKDSSYTANKIVPYDDKDILSSKPLIVAAPGKRIESSQTEEGESLEPLKPSAVRIGSPRIHRRANLPSSHKHAFTFTQPSLEPDFLDRVAKDNVVLESIREEPRSLHGIVRVFNISFSKEVTIRWTHDAWRSSHDTNCVFCSNDGTTDRFAFELPINGDDVSFAIRYKVTDFEFWDNNRGSNYTVVSR